MSGTNIDTTSELSAGPELPTMMQGRVVLRGDDDYARTRQIWNGAVENQPALFAVCETSADVQAAVRVARRHGIPFSVRGGGHHWAGPALCPDGLVIDLSTMRQVIVDPHSRIATVQGGARRVQLHETRHMLAGPIVYPLSEAEQVLRRYAEFAATMPDELGITVGMTSGADGQPMLMFLPLWNGDKHRGDRLMRDLQALGTPQLAQVGPKSYNDMLAVYDPWLDATAGCHWEMRTRSLPALTPGAIDVITRAVAARTSPYSMVNWHHLHGAATRIPAEATAFGLRQQHFMLEIIAGWDPKATNGGAHRQWAQDLWESLAPLALPSSYANQLAPHDREQARHAYGGNGARLRALKRRFDPDGVFASAIPLPD